MVCDVFRLNRLDYAYPGSQNDVLHNCSIRLPEGQLTVLLGANGSGKSTLLRCLLRLLPVQPGMIELYGKPANDYTAREYARLVSYVAPLKVIKTEAAVRNYIAEGRSPYLSRFGTPSEEDYLCSAECAEALHISHLLGQRVHQLSSGQLQLVTITRALAQQTPVIIMDEPMSALDLRNQAEMLALLRTLQQKGKTVLFSSHDPNHALALDCSVWLMNGRRISANGPASDVITETALQQTYGKRLRILEQDGARHVVFSAV